MSRDERCPTCNDRLAQHVALRQIEAHSPLRTFGFSARQLGVMAREALEGDAPT